MKTHSHARRGQAVRRLIIDYIATCPRPPSLREIGEAVGLSSSSTVWTHVRTLREEGKLAPAKLGQPRAILLTDPGPSEVEILRDRVAELEASANRVRDLLREGTGWGSNPSTSAIHAALNVLGRCLPEARHD